MSATSVAPVVQSPAGDIRGVNDGSIRVFKGIPFGAPPLGYHLKIEPQAPFDAQAHYLRRFETLSEAAGYKTHAQAFDTE